MYQVELVCKSGFEVVSRHRLLSAAGSKALKVLNSNRGLKGLECVRIVGPDGVEHSRVIIKAEQIA